MAGKHTVEKIGGTSMSQFGEVMKNVIIANRKGADLYDRVFVVSAYGGITNLLLEDKKTGAPGVYGLFAQNSKEWPAAMEKVRKRMLDYNRSFESLGLAQAPADAFVNERLDGIRDCLNDLLKVGSFGHFKEDDYLPPTREFLAAVGEAHSAYNSVLILRRHGVNARFIDLTGWKEAETYGFDEMILRAFKDVDFSCELPIVTGYVKYGDGIMTIFDRGYSEITFSKVAVLTHAREGIIHKEYHLCTGDPVLVGKDRVKVIGNTNFDIADQLSDLEMEAIHAKASKEMENCRIPIRVKNAFEPEHPGTLISHDYVSPVPRVEMICGRDDLLAIEVFDSDMVGQCGYDYKLTKSLYETGISYIAKNTNANTITHYVPEKSKNISRCIELMKATFPVAEITIKEVALISVIGSNMQIPGFLSRSANALSREGVNVLALDQCMRQVNIQFIVERGDFDRAQLALHRELVEREE